MYPTFHINSRHAYKNTFTYFKSLNVVNLFGANITALRYIVLVLKLYICKLLTHHSCRHLPPLYEVLHDYTLLVFLPLNSQRQ